jgi:hypothetical protein
MVGYEFRGKAVWDMVVVVRKEGRWKWKLRFRWQVEAKGFST